MKFLILVLGNKSRIELPFFQQCFDIRLFYNMAFTVDAGVTTAVSAQTFAERQDEYIGYGPCNHSI